MWPAFAKHFNPITSSSLTIVREESAFIYSCFADEESEAQSGHACA